MFTGIVQHIGTIASIDRAPHGAVIELDLAGWSHRPSPGASIAINGCCLTVTAPGTSGSGRVTFDVVTQTLSATTLGGLRIGDRVNLEHAVTASTMLGGHVVQGHVDGVAAVARVETGEDWRVAITPPPDLLDYIVERGSVAVDGVSLTVAAVTADGFEVALIPTTLELTTLGRIAVGARVNLETDCIARTVVHWLRRHHPSPAPGSS